MNVNECKCLLVDIYPPDKLPSIGKHGRRRLHKDISHHKTPWLEIRRSTQKYRSVLPLLKTIFKSVRILEKT